MVSIYRRKFSTFTFAFTNASVKQSCFGFKTKQKSNVTSVPKVHSAAAEDDHEAVEQGEAIRRRAVHRRDDGDGELRQRLDLHHHLRRA